MRNSLGAPFPLNGIFNGSPWLSASLLKAAANKESSEFFAPLTTSLALKRGTGAATFTRATPATCQGFAPAATPGTAQTTLLCSSGEARFQGARRISPGVWSSNYADGTPIAPATLKGYLSEGVRTNHFLNSDAPATQTSASLGTGTYTLWMTGTGSVAVAQTTATITGAGTATAGTPVTFVVTVAGTVTYTVTGSPTTTQSEDGAFPSSYIPTVGAAVTRNADVLTYSSTSNALTASGTIYCECQQPSLTSSEFVIISDGSSNNAVELVTQGVPTGASQCVIRSGGVVQANVSIGTPLAGALGKFAAIWNTDIGNSYFNSTPGVLDSVVTVPAAFTIIQIGDRPFSSIPNFGNIKNLHIFQHALSPAELLAITK